VVRGLGSEPLWLHAGSRGAAFGYVPPVLAGMDALMLTESAERTRLAPRALEADLRSVELDVTLEQNGGARVSVVETFRGSGAVQWRNQLESVPAAELEGQFEAAYVSNFFPGARLTRLVITGREDTEEPIVLRYDVELDSLGRRTREGIVLPPLFRARLGAQYATVASRQYTQLVASPFAFDVTLRVTPPGDGNVAIETGQANLDGPEGAQVRISSARDGRALVVTRSYRVPRMRVAPEAYPELARFCRASDEAESSEIVARN
jgi:hypothetical protein